MELIKCREVNGCYLSTEKYVYYSARYNQYLTIPARYPSDGATMATDTEQTAFFLHDLICDRGEWDSGAKISVWVASCVYSIVLYETGHKVKAFTRWLPTFLFGGGACKKNGLFGVTK